VATVTRMRGQLRRDLGAAIKVRDTAAVSALRSALAAIENAEALDGALAASPGDGHPHVAGSVVGVGAADVERRVLADGEMEAIVRAELTERLSVAVQYERLGHREVVDRLRSEAAVSSGTCRLDDHSRRGRAVSVRGRHVATALIW